MMMWIEDDKEERLSMFGLRLNLRSFCQFLAWSGMINAGLGITMFTICFFDVLIEGGQEIIETIKEQETILVLQIITWIGITIFYILFFLLNFQYKRRGYKTPELKKIVYFLSTCEILIVLCLISVFTITISLYYLLTITISLYYLPFLYATDLDNTYL